MIYAENQVCTDMCARNISFKRVYKESAKEVSIEHRKNTTRYKYNFHPRKFHIKNMDIAGGLNHLFRRINFSILGHDM